MKRNDVRHMRKYDMCVACCSIERRNSVGKEEYAWKYNWKILHSTSSRRQAGRQSSRGEARRGRAKNMNFLMFVKE
jgi:hypothetical protein